MSGSSTVTSSPTSQLPDEQPVMRIPARPADTNAAGDIFGGWIMSQIDIGGSLLANQCARGRTVTVAVNSIQFLQPVSVGDLVSLYANIIKVGNTSITIAVEVFVERNPEKKQTIKVAEASLTYVAVDQQGRSRPVNPR